MDYELLTITRDGPVEYVTLNRPEVRNAFNEQLIAELTRWAAHAGGRARDEGVRVAVLAGAGKAFCAGADVSWMAKTVHYTEAQNIEDATAASRMFAALNGVPIALVGRIHGAAIGGGAGLAAVCDIAVAEQDAVFAFSEVKLGILPAVISPFTLAKIGRSAARELFLTGIRFSAARAREIGLVHAVVPVAALDATVSDYVREILSAAPGAVAAAKALIADVWRHSSDDVTAMTARAIAMRRVSAEGQEGLLAFLEKRTPGWIERPGTITDTTDTRDTKNTPR